MFDIKKMKNHGSIKVPNYSVLNHIRTMKLGNLLILAMRNSISIICFENKVCIGEFTCDGRVDKMICSNDNKQIFIYTDKCKLYRIQMN